MKRFWRFHALKVLLVLVSIQLFIFAWMQYRNHPPIAQNDVKAVIQNRSGEIPVMRNDKDKDEEEIKIFKFSQAINGTVKQNYHFLEYTPKNDYFGIDSFWYTVSDGEKESEKAWVRVTVNENLPPKVVNDSLEIFPWGRSKISVLPNDSDKENDSIFIQEIGQPVYGTLTLSNNELSYQPQQSGLMVDSFYYILSDGRKLSEKAWVYLRFKHLEKTRFASDPYFGDIKNYQFLTLNRWEIADENNNAVLSLEGGFQHQSGLRLGEYFLVYERLYTGDFDIRLKAKCKTDLGSNDWPDYAVIFAWQNENNYCFAYCSAHSERSGATGLYQIKEGVRQEIAVGGVTFSDNQFHQIRLVRKGNTVSLFSDGKKLVSATNEVLGKKGLIGFGSQDDPAEFDDISIRGGYEIVQ